MQVGQEMLTLASGVPAEPDQERSQSPSGGAQVNSDAKKDQPEPHGIACPTPEKDGNGSTLCDDSGSSSIAPASSEESSAEHARISRSFSVMAIPCSPMTPASDAMDDAPRKSSNFVVDPISGEVMDVSETTVRSMRTTSGIHTSFADDGIESRQASASLIVAKTPASTPWALESLNSTECLVSSVALFPVQKVYILGITKKRRLLLDKTALVELTSVTAVRRHTFPYSEITRVAMVDSETFSVHPKGISSTHTYRSNEAKSIAEKILSAVALSKTSKVLRGIPYQSVTRRNKHLLSSMSEDDLKLRQRVTGVLLAESFPAELSVTSFVQSFSTKRFKNDPSSIMVGFREYFDQVWCFFSENCLHEFSEGENGFDHVREALEDSLQQAVVRPLYATLRRCFKQQSDISYSDRLVQNTMKRIKHKPPQFFGVEDEHVVPSKWATSIDDFAKITKASTATDKLNVVLLGVKNIYQDAVGAGQDKFMMGADALFPVILYVLVQSELKHAVSDLSLMMGLCPSWRLNGESGYYLTMLEAAIMYLQELDLDSISSEEEKRQWRIVELDESLKGFGFL